MYILLLVMVLIAPSLVEAAYPDQAMVLRYEQDQNGAARLWMRFTGNAGEPVVDRPYPVSASSTLPLLREWVHQVVTELNLARTAGTAPQVAPGQVLTGLTPVAPPPTAKSVWRAKVQIYNTVKDGAFGAGALASAISALKTDIENTYQAGFLDAN